MVVVVTALFTCWPDHFTKWVEIFRMKNQEATTIAKILVEKVFSTHGCPLQILTDRGPNFESALLKELCQLMSIDKARTSAYKPSTNGNIERFHRTMHSMLAKLVNDNRRDWDTFTCDRLCLPHLDTRNQRLFSVLPNVRASLNACRPCIRDTSSCQSRPRRSSIRHCTGTKRTSPTGIRVHPTTLGFGRSKTQASIRHAHPARRIPGRISGLGSRPETPYRPLSEVAELISGAFHNSSPAQCRKLFCPEESPVTPMDGACRQAKTVP